MMLKVQSVLSRLVEYLSDLSYLIKLKMINKWTLKIKDP